MLCHLQRTISQTNKRETKVNSKTNKIEEEEEEIKRRANIYN